MRCPRCHHNNSVLLIAVKQMMDAIRRRRECENCSYRFTTFERIEAAPLLVIKKMGIVKNLIVIKFCVGSFALRKRPVAMEQMVQIVDNVENRVRSLGKMKSLQRLSVNM